MEKKRSRSVKNNLILKIVYPESPYTEEMENLEPSYAAGGNVKWSNSGKTLVAHQKV